MHVVAGLALLRAGNVVPVLARRERVVVAAHAAAGRQRMVDVRRRLG